MCSGHFPPKDRAASRITPSCADGSTTIRLYAVTSSGKRPSCRNFSRLGSARTSGPCTRGCRRERCTTIRTPTSRREPPAHNVEDEVLELAFRSKRERAGEKRLHLGERASIDDRLHLRDE